MVVFDVMCGGARRRRESRSWLSVEKVDVGRLGEVEGGLSDHRNLFLAGSNDDI